ncbi:MAG: ATP-binding protein [Acidobacteriota bacterium]|nr:ATP-binding protein [Acidobacteriota bacterium]
MQDPNLSAPTQTPGLRSRSWPKSLVPTDAARIVAGYVAAGTLAWLAMRFSAQVPELGSIRLALSYCVVAGTAVFLGSGPALASLGVTALAARLYLPHTEARLILSHGRITTALVILLTGGLTVLLIRSFRVSERRLGDLVERLQEQAGRLREQAEALIEAQQASRSAAWTLDTRTWSTRWYDGGAEVFGRPHDEITALGSPTSLVLEEDRIKITDAAEYTIRTGLPFRVEFRVLWPDGEIHWLEARGTPLANRPEIWRGTTMDVTERKLADEALIRTEKLAIAGRLAASIAHEINNPLEAITNLCYLARITSPDIETQRYIAMAEEELRRVAQITTQTLRFHRQQTAAGETDLDLVVRSILALFDHKLAESAIQTHTRIAAARPLLCYAGEIRQVIANLVSNAIDAMPTGGALCVRVRPTRIWRSGAGAVRVTIADSGHGMAPETMRRIFEPFFTTKADVGTGLGLWVSSTLVEKHGGHLTVRSSTHPAHRGTVFALVLPYNPHKAPGYPAAANSLPPPRGERAQPLRTVPESFPPQATAPKDDMAW